MNTEGVRLVLVHPPLLAPVVFSRLAPLLRAIGHQVVVPDLREAITSGPMGTWWRRAVDAAATAMPGAEVVVAHSGAGALVPPRTAWWPPGVMESEVPEQGDRVALAEAAPCLPVAFYDVGVPVPPGREPTSRSYLHLSPGYAAEAEDAAVRGWHVEHLQGRHLDVLTRAHAVATAVHQLLQP